MRTILVDKDVVTSFCSFQGTLCLLFPQLKQKNFSVHWTVDDRNIITVTDDEQLGIAFTEMNRPVYKLLVNSKDVGKATTNTEVVHTDIVCNEYEMTPVNGTRYEFLIYADFDLCARSESEGKHPQHDMIKLTNARPQFYQILFRCAQKMHERAGRSQCQQARRNCRIQISKFPNLRLFMEDVLTCIQQDVLLGNTIEAVPKKTKEEEILHHKLYSDKPHFGRMHGS